MFNNKNYGSEILLIAPQGSPLGPLSQVQSYSFSRKILSSYAQDNVIYFVDDQSAVFSIDLGAYSALSNSRFLFSEIDPNLLIRNYNFLVSVDFSEIRGVFRASNATGLVLVGLLNRN